MTVQQEKEPFLTANGDGSVIRGYVHVLDMARAVGEAVSCQGMKLACHTESNSTLWYERDIELTIDETVFPSNSRTWLN